MNPSRRSPKLPFELDGCIHHNSEHDKTGFRIVSTIFQVQISFEDEDS